MAAAWPAVRAALVANLPALIPTYTIYDGPVVSGETPTQYLTIADQPSNESDATGGGFEQVVGPDGFAATETGNVLCELAATTGDAAVPSVFAAFDAITAWLHANQTLGGVLATASTVTVAAQVLQEQNRAGAVQRLLISINYTTRL